jgi:hypothetical protein
MSLGTGGDEAPLTCWGWLEEGSWQAIVGDELWTHAAYVWAWVQNDGPTATLAAQILDVTGVPDDWQSDGRPYFVAEAAWDGTGSSTFQVPSGHRKKLKVASVLAHPRGFWFWTTEHQTESPGWQWRLGERADAEIRFRLRVTDAATGQAVEMPGTIQIPPDDKPTFYLGTGQ